MASFPFPTFIIFLLILGRVSASLSDDLFYHDSQSDEYFYHANLSNEFFYLSSCPGALDIIRTEVQKAVAIEPRMGASLLRLHFHDCFVNGCDASVLLDDTPNFQGEKKANPNKNSLRGFEVIDTIKEKLENVCPEIVSCADILAVAARDSVDALRPQPLGKLLSFLFPFPTWKVELGRRDSLTASFNAANANLPAPTFNLSGLVKAFSAKGFTTQEMVILSGGHTIGKARCTTFRNRIYNEMNINSGFAVALKSNCPSSAGTGDNNTAPLDGTAYTFDNTYFKDLINERGLLHSDQQLFNKGPTDDIVRRYSYNPQQFLEDFGKAMIKMGRLSPPTGSAGEIRRNCRRRN